MGLDLKNMSVRTVSGLAYVGLLIGAIVLGPIVTAIVVSLFAFLASYEIEKNTQSKDMAEGWQTTWVIDGLSLIALIFAFTADPDYSRYSAIVWALFVLFRFCFQIFIPQPRPLKSISIFAFEQFYIGLPLALLVAVVAHINNYWIVVCALSMIWINDTGAYLVGSLFGRNKMYPRLSPNKSWEGFFGGLLFNIGAAFIFFYCFHLDSYQFISNVVGWIFIGICVSIFATLGDLFESLLKRSLSIKDFSRFIPGHGGVLDRIDSLLCVVPALLLAIYIAHIMIEQ